MLRCPHCGDEHNLVAIISESVTFNLKCEEFNNVFLDDSDSILCYACGNSSTLREVKDYSKNYEEYVNNFKPSQDLLDKLFDTMKLLCKERDDYLKSYKVKRR